MQTERGNRVHRLLILHRNYSFNTYHSPYRRQIWPSPADPTRHLPIIRYPGRPSLLNKHRTSLLLRVHPRRHIPRQKYNMVQLRSRDNHRWMAPINNKLHCFHRKHCYNMDVPILLDGQQQLSVSAAHNALLHHPRFDLRPHTIEWKSEVPLLQRIVRRCQRLAQDDGEVQRSDLRRQLHIWHRRRSN